MKKVAIVVLLLMACLSCGYTKEANIVTLDGVEVEYDALVKDSKTVLFMWTTWCPYCRTEFNKIMQDLTIVDGVNFYFLNLGESKSRVESYVNGFKNIAQVKDKIIMDRADTVSKKHNVIGIPTYLIFRDGQLITRLNFLERGQLQQIFDKAE